MTAIFLLVSASCFLLGFYVFRNPRDVIGIQQKFYEKINWRMEPVSMDTEMRNTRYMGLFLMVFVLGAVIYRFLSLP